MSVRKYDQRRKIQKRFDNWKKYPGISDKVEIKELT
jgi:hypothetical protein